MKYKDFYSFLKETPDTIVYNGDKYTYTSAVNRSSYILYIDVTDNLIHYFGYSANSNKFYSDNSELLKEIDDISDDAANPNKYYIDRFYSRDNGGSHMGLEGILDLNMRLKFIILRGRIFEITDENDKPLAISTSWMNKELSIKYKDILDNIATIVGYEPSDMLYQSKGNINFETYEEFYKDKSLELTALETEIDKEIKKKSSEFSEKSSELHTKAAILNDTAKNKLKQEILVLEVEIELLTAAKKEGKSKLEDVKLDRAILMALSRNPKTYKDLRNELESSLEKEFGGISMAQLKQMLADKGVSLKSAVKSVLKEYVRIRNKKK